MAETHPQPTNTASEAITSLESTRLPSIAIKYCTQCKWMLRAAYLAQELLSTFSTSLGEVALIPTTGGIFTITITYQATGTSDATTTTAILWDRKSDGGFPETKELKSRVRNVIDPDRDLGHVDRALKKDQKARQQQMSGGAVPDPAESGSISTSEVAGAAGVEMEAGKGKGDCEDCG